MHLWTPYGGIALIWPRQQGQRRAARRVQLRYEENRRQIRRATAPKLSNSSSCNGIEGPLAVERCGKDCAGGSRRRNLRHVCVAGCDCNATQIMCGSEQVVLRLRHYLVTD